MVVNDVGTASVSEPSLLLDTTKDKWDRGSGSSSRCPREGMMLMESREKWSPGRMMVPTSCNSWRCLGCRDRNLSRFKAMVALGVSALGQCMFITLTYKAGAERLGTAGCVSRDWRAFWRLLRKWYPETKEWGVMRVMEVTKKGTPHFHLIVGRVSLGDIRCYGPVFYVKNYLALLQDCECWSHRMGRVWERVQKGESYIVHTVPVTGGSGAGGYMAKYMRKEFDQERGNELGMVRRFSANRRWPREKRRRIISPGTDGWRRTAWRAGVVDLDGFQGLTEFGKSGSEKQRKASVKDAARRLLKQGRKVVHGNGASSA